MKHQLSPTSLAVWLSVAFIALLFIGGAAIGGSYALTIHTLDTQQAAARATAVKLAAGQKAAAIHECKQLHALDAAHDGITFPKVNHAHPSEEAFTRLFKGIHGVYEASGCKALLKP